MNFFLLPDLPAESFYFDSRAGSVQVPVTGLVGRRIKEAKLMLMLMRDECVVPLFCLSSGRLLLLPASYSNSAVL